MGRPRADISGQRFGRLVAVRFLERRGHGALWRCICDCGREVDAYSAAMRHGTSKSCGCFRKERMAGLTYKHGQTGGANRKRRPPEYKTWDSIKQRCINPNATGFEWYGGRGITIAPEWREDFDAFLAHVGPRPSSRHSIERLDSNGNYEPGNVCWADWVQQANNRSNNRIVEYGGVRMTLKQAADRAGIPYKTVKSRVQKGWSEERALTVPPNPNKVNALRRSHRPAD